MDPPEALKTVFHHVNSKPTEKTWRRLVLGPAAKVILAPGAEPPRLPTFGIKSLDQYKRVLTEFRDVLDSWISVESAYSVDAGRLLKAINERANLRFEGWALDPDSERLVERWATDKSTVPEVLYAHLALALRDVSFRAIHRCGSCGTFFYEPSRRVKFCSSACRNRTMVRRFRERNAGGGKADRKRGTGRQAKKLRRKRRIE